MLNQGLVDFQFTCTPRLNARILLAPPPTLNAAKMFDKKDMESALAKMNSVLNPNVSEIARKWKVKRTTLIRRF